MKMVISRATYTYEELLKLIPDLNIDRLNQVRTLVKKEGSAYSLPEYSKLVLSISKRIVQITDNTWYA